MLPFEAIIPRIYYPIIDIQICIEAFGADVSNLDIRICATLCVCPVCSEARDNVIQRVTIREITTQREVDRECGNPLPYVTPQNWHKLLLVNVSGYFRRQSRWIALIYRIIVAIPVEIVIAGGELFRVGLEKAA